MTEQAQIDLDSQQLLLAFYGDDFTGSTDALESLVLNGIPAMLFLHPPSRDDLRSRFPHLQAIGVAGEARSMTPSEMGQELPSVFEKLADLQPRTFHYKVCSTFDSAPHTGNLGVAAEIASSVFQQQSVYMLGGAPHLGRYLVFGHLFARYGGDGRVYRIDRHPVMREHPSTPMTESDLALHIQGQNQALEVTHVSFEEVREHARQGTLQQLDVKGTSTKRLVLLDAVTQEDSQNFARFVHEAVQQASPAVLLGPSSIENALACHWQQIGRAKGAQIRESVQGVDRLLVLSGSCSPVTTKQVEYAVEHGFARVDLDPQELLSNHATLDDLRLEVLNHLSNGKSVIVATCHGEKRGPGSVPFPAKVIGRAFATLLNSAMIESPLERVVLAGGDTSSHTLRGLPVTALEMVAPISPGVPLCKLHATDPNLNEVEIALKGGQLGGLDYFVQLQDGRA